MKNLLDPSNPENVTIQGKEVSTEEAALVFDAMSTEERATYQGMTDIEIIESIYTTQFDYFPAKTDEQLTAKIEFYAKSAIQYSKSNTVELYGQFYSEAKALNWDNETLWTICKQSIALAK